MKIDAHGKKALRHFLHDMVENLVADIVNPEIMSEDSESLTIQVLLKPPDDAKVLRLVVYVEEMDASELSLTPTKENLH